MKDAATDYARWVIDNPLLSCKWVRLAAARHMRDLKNPKFFWDVAESNKRIEMASTLYHYQGAAKGTRFIVEPWEAFLIGCTFGWKMAGHRRRRFKYVFCKVPKKNGKTFIGAAVSVMMLIAGGNLEKDGRFSAEGGAEIYFVATKEDQAKKGWGDMTKIVKRSPGYSSRLTVRVKEVRHNATDSVCKPLGSDSDTLDGLNPFCVIKDELHAWKDRRLWDIMEDGFGARSQPLDFIITTEGTTRGSISDEITDHAEKILEGGDSYAQDNFFAIIYTIDEGDDPFEERTWFKANPCLGVTGAKSLEYMREQADMARKMPGKLAAFMTKQLNVRMDADNAWLSMDQWDACNAPVDLDTIRGVACFGGLDLARVSDWTSACLCFPAADGTVDLIWKYWIPQETFDKLAYEGRVPVRAWKSAGLLTIAGDTVTDFEIVENDLIEWSRLYQIEEFGYDPYFATDLANRLAAEGIKMVEIKQNFTNYTPPCTELERILAGARARHGGHAIARWNAGNVILREGPSGNRMPDKGKSKAKIDGISAALMALRPIALRPADVGGGVGYSSI
jgi:phage terminase large subunit-like protein